MRDHRGIKLSERLRPSGLCVAAACLAALLSGCPAEEATPNGPHRISVAATPSSGEVNGPAVTISVTVLGPDGSPLAAGSRVDLIEFGCVDANSPAVGLFDDQQSGDCGRTTRTVTGSNGALSASFRCVREGTTRLLAAPTGISDPPGETTVTCNPGPTGQWSVTTIVKADGILEVGSNIIAIEATAVQDDGTTPAPAGTKLKVSIESGTSMELNSAAVASTNAQGVAGFNFKTTSEEGETVIKVEFSDARFGTGASQSFRVRPPSDTRDTALEVEVRRDNLIVEGAERTVLADDQDALTIEAEMIAPAGADFSVEGQPVTFKVTSGPGFFEGGVRETQINTDNNNRASIRFIGGDAPGTALIEITATDPNPELVDEKTLTQNISINVNSLGFIEFVSINPNVLYVKGSGQNETALVTFRVMDTNRQPLEGMTVRMALPSNPLGGVSLTDTQPQSDENGVVATTIVTGRSTGAVNVTATAQLGSIRLEAPSSSIPVVGARPTRNAFNLQCEFLNIGGFIGRQGDRITVNNQYACSSTLFDRFGNPIGVSQRLTYLSEGGNIISPQTSVEWDTASTPNAPPDNVGRVAAPYSPAGEPPCDVDPDQTRSEPFLLFGSGECSPLQNNCPRRSQSECSRNPRDGLVTIVAITTGEEAFNDFNNNGEYDAGEPFWDLGEPFLDVNDNNTFEEGENFRDLANEQEPQGNAQYDGPNGVWDANTTIWTSTNLLLSGDPVVQQTSNNNSEPFSVSGFGFDAADPNSTILPGELYEVTDTTVVFGVRWQDANLNVLNRSASYAVELVGDATGITLDSLSVAQPSPQMGFSVEYTTIELEDDVNTYATRLRSMDQNFYPFRARVTVNPETSSGSITVRYSVTYQTSPGAGTTNTVFYDFPLRFVPGE